MSLLAAILAGGQSSRFGSDKAQARLGEKTLLEHAVSLGEALSNDLCLVGREAAGFQSVCDWPRPGMGPLVGIAGAMRYAQAVGHSRILSLPVDAPDLPSDLVERLSPAPAYVTELPVAGLWHVSDLGVLEDILLNTQRHSLRAFAEACGAQAISLGTLATNINTPTDLATRGTRAPLRAFTPNSI